tara:strand:+ start:554 stop:781 length:228 start_codon:yes stop_codon:yes gene_type:complete
LTSSLPEKKSPTLSFEGNKYSLQDLPKETQELVKGMQVADAQLRMHEDTLKVLALGRQAMARQLKEALKDVPPSE